MTSAPQYLVLGDDLTGSLEAGALYARSGTACVVSVSKGLPDGVSAEAVVVDTETRHVDPERASASITKTIVDARACGISKIYLKVDSTLRGSIPAQLRGALAGWPGRSIVFTPAYPRMGRTVRAGRLYVNDQLLTETAFARDPIDPLGRAASPRGSQRESAAPLYGLRARKDYATHSRLTYLRSLSAMQNQRSSCAISHSSLSMLDGLVFAPDLRGCWPS